MAWPSIMISVAVCMILIWVIVEDMRRFKVRNVAVLLLAALFVLDCFVRQRLPLIVPHAVFAGIGLAVLLGAFTMRALGGGDAKLLSAALFWVGPEGLLVFAVLLLVCTVIYSTGAWLRWLPSRVAAGRMVIPFGPCVAVAWLAHLTMTAWFRS